MSERTSVAPYGSWSSPLDAGALVADTVTLLEPRVDGDDVTWLEGRPSDGGRVTLVRRALDGSLRDVTRSPTNVRSRVHEYGGGAYDVSDGVTVFCSFDDRRVYRCPVDDAEHADPVPITPEGPLRYGDLRLLPGATRLLAVCEDHGDSDAGPVNRLVLLDVEGDNADGGRVLADGHDFVSSAALSPDGALLAWLHWDHPDMPWDSTELWVGRFDAELGVTGARVVAGGPGESVTQPRWAPDGRLVFVSDRTGWWNLYTVEVAASEGLVGSAPQALWPAEHDFADPQWVLGSATYGITDEGVLVTAWLADGYTRFGTVDLRSGERTEVGIDATAIFGLDVAGTTGAVVASRSDRPMAVMRLELARSSGVRGDVLREAAPRTLDAGFVSRAEPVSWRAADGSTVFGLYYGPHNPGWSGPDGALPPLLVTSHGGPTGMSKPMLDMSTQYWTTRGVGVLSVNYGGSSGFGRAYRERLRGAWGVVDVDDCVSGALAMVESGRADRERLAIRGGSAGGYTTLAALTFRDVFRAGCSLYGVGDLEALARDTHKFESRYLDGLIGPYPVARDVYLERSPVHHVDRLDCPLILLQGRDDPVVPLNQAEEMAEAVRAKGLPVALIVFDGEGHGFRRADSLVRAIEAEAYFYSRVFGFELADPVPPIEIENLPD